MVPFWGWALIRNSLAIIIYCMAERGGSGLLASIDGQHASLNTKEHAVYAYFFL